MIKKISGILIVFIVLILAGCKQDTDNTKLNPYLYDYAPVNIGHTVVYDVDSISYNFVFGGTQTVNDQYYQLQEVVLDTFIGQLGTVMYQMAENKRYDTTQPFQPYQQWVAYFNGPSYLVDQNDLTFIKLVFPPIRGVNWQGNEYLPANDTIVDTYQVYNGWTYTITAANVPAVINNIHLDSTVTVLADSNQNLVNDVVSTETYARHIGLVYRRWEVIGKQSISSTWANPDSANGFRIVQRLHSYTP